MKYYIRKKNYLFFCACQFPFNFCFFLLLQRHRVHGQSMDIHRCNEFWEYFSRRQRVHGQSVDIHRYNVFWEYFSTCPGGRRSTDNLWISTDTMYSGNTFPQCPWGRGSTDNQWTSTDTMYIGNNFPGGRGSTDNLWISTDTMYCGNTILGDTGSTDNPWISMDTIYSVWIWSMDNPWIFIDSMYSGNTFPCCSGGTGSGCNKGGISFRYLPIRCARLNPVANRQDRSSGKFRLTQQHPFCYTRWWQSPCPPPCDRGVDPVVLTRLYLFESMDNPWISTDTMYMYSGNTFPQCLGGRGSTDNLWTSTDTMYSGNTFPGGRGSTDNLSISTGTMYSGNTFLGDTVSTDNPWISMDTIHSVWG